MSTTRTATASASSAHTLDEIVDRVEHASLLDGVGSKLAKAIDRALPDGGVRDVASGVPIGHPVHPLLVAVPIGSWTAATYLDLTRGDRKAARRLVGLGVLTAVPAALTGSNDWLTTTTVERRVGLVHAALNNAAVVLYSASWLARRRGRHARGVLLSLAGLTVTGASGWLGGHLSYALGTGVDTTAFENLPEDWTDACAEADVPADGAIKVDVAGVAVLLTRYDDAIVALADRCTHRGGPLHEGTVADGCVTCPWHGTQFALRDGVVQRGPGTRPQPTLRVRLENGRVQLRRGEDE